MAGEYMDCPLCNQNDTSALFTVGEYPIVKCRSCGLVRVHEIPGPDVLERHYSDEYYAGRTDDTGYYDYEAERKALAKGFRNRLQRLKGYAPSGRLLDVGCALGFLLAEAQQLGWKPYGIDRAAYGINWARQNLGIENLFAGRIADAPFPRASFDAVTMIDVLEHVTDPVKEITSIARLTKPGGIFMLDIWDIGSTTAKLAGPHWPIICPPDHLFYFDKKTIAMLLEMCGFSILSISRMGRHISPATLATKISHTSPLKNKVLGITRKLTMPIPINLYDNMIVVSRREV